MSSPATHNYSFEHMTTELTQCPAYPAATRIELHCFPKTFPFLNADGHTHTQSFVNVANYCAVCGASCGSFPFVSKFQESELLRSRSWAFSSSSPAEPIGPSHLPALLFFLPLPLRVPLRPTVPLSGTFEPQLVYIYPLRPLRVPLFCFS